MVRVSIKTILRGLRYGFLLLKVTTNLVYKLSNKQICLLDWSAKLLVR